MCFSSILKITLLLSDSVSSKLSKFMHKFMVGGQYLCKFMYWLPKVDHSSWLCDMNREPGYFTRCIVVNVVVFDIIQLLV